MSPIGRVFIVLNLVLAAGFAVLSGSVLNKQDNYRVKLLAEQEAHKQTKEDSAKRVAQLEQERNTFEVAKTSNESQLNSLRVDYGNAQDEIKSLKQITGQQAADLKKMASLQETQDQRLKAAFDQAKEAYDASIAAINTKDESVRAKDAAEAENRTLKTTIASLNETIDGKNVEIAALKRDNDEQKLLVAAAVEAGFSPAMAAPTLAGTVTNVSGRLCTIAVAENPGNVDIQDQILRRPFRIAVYDEAGYKAEVVATKYEPSANAILCNVMFTKDSAQIKTGDRASTK